MKRYKDWSIRNKLIVPLFAVMVFGSGGIIWALIVMHDEIMNVSLSEERVLDDIRRVSLELLSEYREFMIVPSDSTRREIEELKEEIDRYDRAFDELVGPEETKVHFVEAIKVAQLDLKRIGDETIAVRLRLLDYRKAMEAFESIIEHVPAGGQVGVESAEDRQDFELRGLVEEYISELREYMLRPNDATRQEIAEIERSLERFSRADDGVSELGNQAQDADESSPIRQLIEAGRISIALATEFLAKYDDLEQVEDALWSVLNKAGSVVSQETDEAFDIGFASVAALISALLVMITLVGYAVTRELAKSVTVLANEADRFGAGDLDARANVEGEDEIGGLATAFNQMAMSLKSSIEQRERIENALKVLNEDLVISRDESVFANRTKSEFLANMSHELRTPLNAILGFSELMGSGTLGPLGNPKYEEYAKDINDSGRHLLALIDDILDLSKVEAGRLELDEEDIDVARAIRSCMVLVKERARNGGVKLITDIPHGLPALRADQRKLKQILVNLLSNAVKFTPADGEVTLKVWSRPDSGYVFQVIDTGIGIALADIPTALSPFGQIDSQLDRKFEGTGLGLPLTKSLVEVHGGSLDLQSEVGAGTTVTVRFPKERIVHVSEIEATGTPVA